MFYRIKPLDTLFFRDGRPFTMGSDTWANLIFPPYPSTIYGAIRTWLIFERGSLRDFEDGRFEEELGRIIKDEKNNVKEIKKGNFKIKGPLIAINENLYFPIPNDLLKEKDSTTEEKNCLFQINITQKPKIFISDYDLEDVLINKSDFELDEAEGFLDIAGLIDYLKGKEVVLQLTKKDEVFERELKTGIKRSSKTLTSEENYLYRIPMIRLKREASLFIQIEGLNSYPDQGLIQLGGESKTVQIERYNVDLLESLKNLSFEFKNKIFKLYLATHVIFENGWLPKWIDKTSYVGNFKGIELKLISSVIGKYNLIGGWDLANQRPKPMYKAVPAGSIYYFKILDDTNPEKIKETFHFKNISDINPEEGFGLSLIGEV